ncbi:MAG: TDP-N-acetylfucosamine:lipid II N-acetylfucosaminyltransferase [Lacibacter sp.]
MVIAHVMIFEKFNERYINFIDANFSINDHVFFIIGTNYAGYDTGKLKNTVVVNSYPSVVKMFLRLAAAKKIILHGLWHSGFIRLLNYQPWLVKKCYWMMWGGDFYYHDRERAAKKKLIGRLKHFVSLVEGDYQLVKKWYAANGTFHQSILYTYLSNEEFEIPVHVPAENGCTLLVGNSADPSNNHVQIFEQLVPYKHVIGEVLVPLSYGNQTYAQEVIAKGTALLGNKFKPLVQFMSLEEYRAVLQRTDIAVFNHNRQQGLGNLIALLAYGKKVFLRKEVTTWKTFTDLGITLYDVSDLELSLISKDVSDSNRSVMRQFFSAAAYKQQLQRIFNS